jgi:hypothetical protein
MALLSDWTYIVGVRDHGSPAGCELPQNDVAEQVTAYENSAVENV